ncbi:MAG: D-alanyl-D-alanine dipeptidase [Alloprevotella sp.]|nr:D-alanyl-D-alanine dipeptidase [Alloprevotella sp.]MBR1595006.1 D-alanyl-D-alanine dipeptidase [Alloprevotella sp.]
MIEAGLVCLADVCPDVQVNLVLGQADNFLGKRLYTDLQTAYLHPQAALALKKSQAALKRSHPELSLLVLDAARPMSVQGHLYATVVGTAKNIYISDPRSGGDQHNYGLAVDITLCDAETGKPLDMGTDYGVFEAASGLAAEEKTEGEGALSEEAVNNRKLLRRVMAVSGYKPLRTQWWHFNFRTRSEAKANFTVIK